MDDTKRRFALRSLNTAELLVLGFAGVILFGAILLSLPFASVSGESVGFVNALFTAASAVAVTGLVVVDTAVSSPLSAMLPLSVIPDSKVSLLPSLSESKSR